MTGPTRHSDPSHQPRRDRMDAERTSDPYRAREKWPEPTTCPDCSAIFSGGRWQWGVAAAEAESHLCPACRRVRERVPAAQLVISGEFFKTHRDEILHLMRNAETKARGEHPLERIMDVMEEPERVTVTFTETHLAHGIGQALQHAYRGELDSHYTDEGDLLRVMWKR